MPAASRSNLFSVAVSASPAARLRAAAITDCLNADLPARPASAAVAPASGLPPTAVPAAKPPRPTATDSSRLGPCCARLATNQSSTPRLGSPMSVNCRSNGEVLARSASCWATMRPPVSSAPASCKPRPARACMASTPRPKFFFASRHRLGLRIDSRYCPYACASRGTQSPEDGKPVPGADRSFSDSSALAASSASNTMPCTNTLLDDGLTAMETGACAVGIVN